MGLALCGACVSEDHDLAPKAATQTKGETGQLHVALNADASFQNETRALNVDDYRNVSNYTVQVINTANQNVLLECLGSELAANLPKELEGGSYEVRAYYGTESAASRNNFRVEGSSVVTIQAHDEKNVTVNCIPTCGKLSVAFANDMATYYDDYSVSYTGAAALGSNSISWSKTDTEPWYVKLDENGETLTYTISVTAKSDYAHVDANGTKQTSGSVTGTFQLQRNRAHKLTVSPNYSPTTEGGLTINITIDESTNDKPITIQVPVSWTE